MHHDHLTLPIAPWFDFCMEITSIGNLADGKETMPDSVKQLRYHGSYQINMMLTRQPMS